MHAVHDPLKLPCGLEVAGRVALAPLTNTQSHSDGSLGEDELKWLLMRADGGFPWISTCAAFVSEEGKAWDGQLGIASDDHVAGLTRLAAALRSAGSATIVQLHHAGAKATLAPERPLTTADRGPDGSRGASIDDLRRVEADFVSAARRAERAGFSGVEIHGANGYLFTQFLAPEDNPRRDEYGGDLANRARFLRETLQAVRAAVTADFAVGVRISPVDVWDRRGLTLDDGVQLARWLAEDGADFIHLSLRGASDEPPHEPGRGPVARAVREAVPKEVSILAAGGIWTGKDASRAFAAGADVVALGRSAIAPPDWPEVSGGADWAPSTPPWNPVRLRAAGVGPAFLDYLQGCAGMVVGGRGARG